jgi:hypothetical protein
MSWFLRSLADAGTHRGHYSIVIRSVHAVCGIEFVPKELGERNNLGEASHERVDLRVGAGSLGGSKAALIRASGSPLWTSGTRIPSSVTASPKMFRSPTQAAGPECGVPGCGPGCAGQ